MISCGESSTERKIKTIVKGNFRHALRDSSRFEMDDTNEVFPLDNGPHELMAVWFYSMFCVLACYPHLYFCRICNSFVGMGKHFD